MTARIGIALCKLRTLVYPLNATDVTKEGLVLLFQIFWDWIIFWQHWNLLGLLGLIYLRTCLAHTFVLFFPSVLLNKLSARISRRYLKARTFFFLASVVSLGKIKLHLCLWFPLCFPTTSFNNSCNFRKENWEKLEKSCCDSVTKLLAFKLMHWHP